MQTSRWSLLLLCSLALTGGAVLGLRRGHHAVPADVSDSAADASGQSRKKKDKDKEQPLRLPLHKPEIVVLKSERILQLRDNGRLLRTYRVALGTSPVGDKEREGDRRTPEGRFYITTKNAHSQFYRSLGLSYPAAEDAERGLKAGLITPSQYRQIVSAVRQHRTPPQTTPLGGKVLLHGGGSQDDWTYGCVALENSDMLELFRAISLKTAVLIRP